MTAQDYIEFISARVPYKYYPYAFPTSSQDACAVVKPYGGLPKTVDTKIERPSFQVLVRGDKFDIESTEAKAIEIYEALSSLQEVIIGGRGVTRIQGLGSGPVYIGMDSNDRPQFSVNFGLTVRPGRRAF